MTATITIDQAAKRIGVSRHVIREWVHRADHPLPSIQVGKTGRFLRIIADSIDPWLAAEAARKASRSK